MPYDTCRTVAVLAQTPSNARRVCVYARDQVLTAAVPIPLMVWHMCHRKTGCCTDGGAGGHSGFSTSPPDSQYSPNGMATGANRNARTYEEKDS
eukprot:COSAG06_NODE_52456_length_305_cov_1.009709_1_plen_93_part_10